jgi:hypothetical protein
MTIVDERPAPAASHLAPSPAVRIGALLIALAPAVAQIAFLVTKDRTDWPLLFNDDAYYYFGVARHLGEGAGSTFAGLVETNGYHPLWTLMLATVATVVRDPFTFLAAVVVLQCVLWVLVVREGMAIGRRLGSEGAALVGLVLLGVLAVLTGQLSFSGMESAPLLVLLLLAVRLVIEREPGEDRGADLRLGVVLALVCLTRLDAVLTVVPLALVALDGSRGAARRRRLARLLGPATAALAVYAVVNQAVFGTATPVSGQAKSLGAPFFNLSPVEAFLEAGYAQGRQLWLGAVTLVLLAVVGLHRAWRRTEGDRRLARCAVAFMAGQALMLVYLVVATSYPIWAWYLYNLALVAFCAGTLAARAVDLRVGRRTVALGVGLAAAFAVVQVPALFLSNFSNGPPSLATARFIDEELPEHAVIAMGDRAGLVGYLADRPLLQLEGLVADAEWLDDMENGTALDRMAAEGVDYYVLSGVSPGGTATVDGRPCQRFVEPRAGDGPKFRIVACDEDLVFFTPPGPLTFTVWRFRPELNPPPGG